jgi:citrate lyase subunit beta-like protein
MNLSEICRASPYLSGVIFAAEDFALDLSLTRTPGLSEFLYARSAMVTAARAYNLPSVIDLVCTDYKDKSAQERFTTECENGKSRGFNGKQCIHPSQVDACQSIFSPSEEEAEWAVRIVIANNKADRQGRGAWTLDGKMIDAPVVGKAKAIVSRAEKCGIDIARMMNIWAEEEPK